MKKNIKLYVAYGSNLNVEQMKRRCPTAEIVGAGELRDWELSFRRVATIEPKKGAVTPVGVWRIKARDEWALDRYEGFPHLYRKENVEVKMKSGETIRAMVYIMNSGKPEPPFMIYYLTIQTGYKDFGLDPNYLQTAAKL